jgi:serine/threonine protein kinase
MLDGYRVERLIGRGGMGSVYLARDTRLGRQVALKLLVSERAADDRFRERFLRESRLAASLDHPSIVARSAAPMVARSSRETVDFSMDFAALCLRKP